MSEHISAWFGCSTEEFLRDTWETSTLLGRGHRERFQALVDNAEIDRVIGDIGPSAPEQIMLVRDGEPVPRELYCFESGRCVPSAVFQLHEEQGATLILPMFHLASPALRNLCRSLESDLLVRAQTNVYATPPHSAGFAAHYDTHDVFVLQVSGSKQWELFDGGPTLPTPDERFQPEAWDVGDPVESFEMSAGDVLYVPRGVVHRARTKDEASLHVTIGVFSPSIAELIVAMVQSRADEDRRLRRSWMPYFAANPEAAVEALSAAVEEVGAALRGRAPAEATFRAHVRDLARTRVVCHTDARQRVRDAAILRIGDVVRRTRPLVFDVWREGDRCVVLAHGVETDFDGGDELRVRALLDGELHTVATDADVRVAQALLRNGVLILITESSAG